MEKPLERKGKCASCNGAVVGEKGSDAGICVNCGAKVSGTHAEPTEAIRSAVRETLKEFGFEPKKVTAQNDDEL